VERENVIKEKRINNTMSAKKYTEFLKENNIEKFDEGKLVSDWASILKVVTDKIQSKLGKEYQKNPEKGVAMINTIGAMVGAKVTDKKQMKGKLFLKFGDPLEETIEENKAAKLLKKVKGLSKQQIQMLSQLPTPVLTSMINQLSVLVAGDIQEDAAVDAANLKAKQTEEMERLKEKQVAEMEALKDRHARQMDAINLQKEKEAQNKAIEAEREAARKAATNEEVLYENEKGLKNKAEKSGMPLGILKQVYNRGLAAYKTGHRPGATAPQWAMARVNSFVTKSKGTWGGADKDLAAKVKGKTNEDKEEQDRDVSKNKGTQPKKYYKGLDKETKQKRDAHFKQGKTGPAPGDEDEDGKPIKTKKSTHTKKFAKMYGEKLDKNSDAGDYIDDFRKSDAPQFKGKSDKKIRKMAIAAFLDKKDGRK
tara:strand:- start:62 stop:1330 length:1269 start_codon:yes stop_codon:yes gene_type:complete